MKILIADDSDAVIRYFMRVLNMYDYKNVVVTNNGIDAVSLCEGYHPDVIFMDLNMPLMNGCDATKLISKEYPNIKVYGMSSEAKLLEGCDAPFEEVYKKPIEMHTVKGILDAVQI